MLMKQSSSMVGTLCLSYCKFRKKVVHIQTDRSSTIDDILYTVGQGHWKKQNLVKL